VKNLLFLISLRVFKIIASLYQIGNEHKRSPKLTEFIGKKSLVQNIRYPEGWPVVYNFLNAQCISTYGGAVIDSSNKVYSELTHFPWGKNLHPVTSSPFLGKRLKSIEKAIFIVTPEASYNFYHWYVDLLPRLILCKILIEDFSSRHIIIHSELKKYEKEFYEYLGIDFKKIICLNNFNVLPVADLLVPQYTFDESALNLISDNSNKWKKDVFEWIKINVFKIDSADKNQTLLYLERGKNNRFGRNLIGEEELIINLKEMGFQVYNPINNTIKEQAEIASKAKCIVSVHGAAMTSMVYCQENTLIIELRSKLNPPEFYSKISKNFGFNFRAIELSPVSSKKNDKAHPHKTNSYDLNFEISSIETVKNILNQYL
jgi:hypothetical protein